MEARKLVSIGSDIYQRDQQMIPAAALAWQSMRQSAEADSITLQVVSAYRSVDYQLGIITRKLEKGLGIDEILRVSAAPGFSEHHSGRAIDITMPDYPVLEEEFELSEAFSWLTQFAADFDFQMSFPRNNPHSVAYEPWHWAWRA
jgi:D-alanyl-D-alanine carboxypeptidase